MDPDAEGGQAEEGCNQGRIVETFLKR